MDELHTPPTPSDDLLLYNRLADTIRFYGNQVLRSNEDAKRIYMSLAQLTYCISYYSSSNSKPMSGSQIMFCDDFCRIMSGSPRAVFPEELLLNDEYIADTFAEVMYRHKIASKSYSHGVTAADIFNLSANEIKKTLSPCLSASELSVFGGSDDSEACLHAASAYHLPIQTENGRCIAEKLLSPNFGSATAVAIVYCNAEDGEKRLCDLLTGSAATASRVSVTPSATTEILAELISRHDEIHISTGKLPKTESGRYSPAYANIADVPYLELANAFLTDSVFGHRVLIVSGEKRRVRSFCQRARRQKLSVFEDIKLKQRKKKKAAINDLTVSARLIIPLMTSVSNNPVKAIIPDHDTSRMGEENVIPTASMIYERARLGVKDSVYSATLSVKDSPLPYHSGIYAIVAPLLEAALGGVNLSIGELSMSINASLCFEGGSAGHSIAALLGLYRAQVELPLPSVTDLHIDTNSEGVCQLTVSVHSASVKQATLELANGSVKDFLLENADKNGLPDFEMIRKLVSGDIN